MGYCPPPMRYGIMDRETEKIPINIKEKKL